MIYLIDDDHEMSACLVRYLKPYEVKCFTNGIDALVEIDEDAPELIFLDILLDGPDGFTLLNELMSYENTAQIPVVIITSLNLASERLKAYNVKKVLNKSEMTPKEVQKCLELI